MVSQGAEVIADGNVHVYGPLRGKAMAGASGDTSARIFTTQLDAELLAVAGVSRVVEDTPASSLHNPPALVPLDRSEEAPVGKGCVSKCRSRGCAYNSQNKI